MASNTFNYLPLPSCRANLQFLELSIVVFHMRNGNIHERIAGPELMSNISFGVSVLLAWLIGAYVTVYIFDWYEMKWGASLNFMADVFFSFVVVPIASTSFTVGTALSSTAKDPWRLSAVAGCAFVLMLGAYAQISRSLTDSVARIFGYSLLLLGPAIFSIVVHLYAQHRSDKKRL